MSQNQFQYASFWERAGALVIDVIITAIPSALFSSMVGSAYASRATDDFSAIVGGYIWTQIGAVLFAWVYYATMESSKYQGTLGKVFVGIKVVDLNGAPVNFGKASLRFVGRFLSILLGVGFLIQPFTQKRQALHDILAGCLVVRRREVGSQRSNSFSQPDVSGAEVSYVAEAVSSKVTSKHSVNSALSMPPIDDGPFYEQALTECEEAVASRKPSTWAKAFALTEGDEVKAKAKYIELRVAELVMEESSKRQLEWEKIDVVKETLKDDVLLHVHLGGGVQFKMRLIPAGTFMMGSPGDEAGRSPDERQHEVTISRPFWMAEHPVTQGLYERVMGRNPSNCKEGKVLGLWGGSTVTDRPVENVSWIDATRFIRRLNELIPQSGFRLPTEAEWEYACRAGTEGSYHGHLASVAWYAENSQSTTHPVGLKKPNAWGLYDMHGNVYEWCLDCYGTYPGTVTDPAGAASGSYRVLRGGNWNYGARYCRSAYRDYSSPSSRFLNYGFRLARTLP